MTQKAIADSSVWIELFGHGPLSVSCKKILADYQHIGVPSIVLYEVYKKVRSKHSEELGLAAVAYLKQHGILDFTAEIALHAADLSLEFKLPMADSIVLAHAHTLNAQLVTLDNDFTGLPGVRVIRKR